MGEAQRSDEDGCGDFFEGQVLSWAAGAGLPGEKELAVAFGKAVCRGDVELSEGAVDPVCRAFEFGEDADRGLVKDKVGCRSFGVGVFGAELLVVEGGAEAEACEDLSEGGCVGDFGFGFDAGLVDAGKVFVVWMALVGEDVAAAVIAQAKKFSAGFEVAGGGVVEGVALKGARSVYAEAEVSEFAFQAGEVFDG